VADVIHSVNIHGETRGLTPNTVPTNDLLFEKNCVTIHNMMLAVSFLSFQIVICSVKTGHDPLLKLPPSCKTMRITLQGHIMVFLAVPSEYSSVQS